MAAVVDDGDRWQPTGAVSRRSAGAPAEVQLPV